MIFFLVIIKAMAKLHHHLKNAFIPQAGNNYRPHALRHHWLGVYGLTAILVKVLVVLFATLYASPAQVSDVTPISIIRLTNEARKNNNVAILRSNPLLNKAAQAKANDMIRGQYFSHISPSKVTPWYWFKQAGYSYRYAGENLAIDFIDSADIIKAWLASPSHRRNLLSTKYKEVGVAVASGKINSVESLLVVQMFGTQLPKTVTKRVTTPAQTPSATSTKQQLTELSTPAPTVLGEEQVTVPVTAPITPTLATPAPNTVVRTIRPEIIGTAAAGSVVQLYVDDQLAGQTITEPSGVYSVIPSLDLTEGIHQLQVQALANDQTSPRTTARAITIDATAPTITDSQTFVLPSMLGSETYDIWVATNGDFVEARCSCGGASVALQATNDVFHGRLSLAGWQNGSTEIVIKVSDQAGNEIESTLIDPDLFNAGVVESNASPTVTALRLLFYSRTFLMVFIALMLVLAVLNIAIHFERQHHPTIIGTMLVIFLAGTLLLI